MAQLERMTKAIAEKPAINGKKNIARFIGPLY